MAKKKQFAPHIYPEWGELFANLSDQQNAEILKAITQFPNYEPENNPIWNFIKSQIEKDYEIFIEKCNKNESIIRNYWQKKKSNDNESISDDNERIRTNANEYECLPKRITDNEITDDELRITETQKNFSASDIRSRIEYAQFISAYKEVFNRSPRLSNAQLANLAYIVANDKQYKSNIIAVLKYIKGQKYYDSMSIFKDSGEKYFCILKKMQEEQPIAEEKEDVLAADIAEYLKRYQ